MHPLQQNKIDGRVFAAIKEMKQHLSRQWSVEMLATKVGVSTPHFQRLFKENMGISPMRYLTDLRLERARELIADPDCFLQVKQIGVAVGITNASHLAARFQDEVWVDSHGISQALLGDRAVDTTRRKGLIVSDK